MTSSPKLTKGLTAALAAGFLALVLAFVPSPLRLFDLFDSAEAPDLHEPPTLKLAVMPPVDAYGAIVQRPIFNADRIPDPATSVATSMPAPQAAEGDLSEFRLVGIVADGVTARALLARGSAPAVKVRPGDKLGEWRIDTIDSTGVAASSNGRKTKIVILKAQPAPATP
jgi:hypothetical protein